MGYPEDFKIQVSDTQAYRQFGNSVVVPVIERIAKEVSETLKRPLDQIPDFALKLGERNRKTLETPIMPKKQVKYKIQSGKK